MDFEVLAHPDTFDAQHMAESLHISGRHVAKTVLLRADRGFAYIVAILPATKRVDLQQLSAAFGGSHLEFATEAEIAEHCPDCEFGVLPPFGSQYDIRTIVDAELAKDDWIVFEGPTHHEAIRIAMADFLRVEQPLVAPFAVAPRATPSARE
jgi:Ala-tRNA(Pro) deacylase